MSRTFLFLQVLTLTILSSRCSPQSGEAPYEYLGCYLDGDEKFIWNPGEYLPDLLSPIKCVLACSKSWSYAGLKDGRYCFCASEKPAIVVSDNECNRKCPGNWQDAISVPSCGGVNRLSVYDLGNQISGLHLRNSQSTEIYKEVLFKADISNGKNVTFKFYSGDGNELKPRISTKPEISYIYASPGFYQVSVEAQNNISKTQTATNNIQVTDAESSAIGTLLCHRFQEYGQNVECAGMIHRGSPLSATFDFGDGVVETIEANVKYGSVGVHDITIGAPSSPQNKQFTVVIPSHRFNVDSFVYAWEIDVVKPGITYLQIFRPTCSIDEIYCSRERACLAKEKRCEPSDPWECGSNEIFCMVTERCVAQSSSVRCQSIKDHNFTMVPADFKLVSQQKYEIDNTGRHFLKLDSPTFVQQNDVIGWTSDGGELTFQDLYTDAPPELSYNFEITLGGVMSREHGILRFWQHVIRAHYINFANFYLRHNYTATGAFIIGSNLTNHELVYVDIPINEIQLVCPTYKFTFESFAVFLENHLGTNVTYRIDFGNTKNNENKDGVFKNTYSTPGVYQINLTASNSVSSKTDSCVVRAYDDITDLKLQKKIQPAVKGSATIIQWCIEKGTNVSFEISFGDSEKENILDFSNYCHQIEHTYAEDGIYNVDITAKNDINSIQTISAKATVDIPISYLTAFTRHSHLTQNVYLDLNEPLEVIISYAEGTRVLCSYHFEEELSTITSSDTTMVHAYQHVGVYYVNVTCSNSISSDAKTINATVVVERLEEITGLEIISSRTVFGEQAVISASMKTGSLYMCKWSLGDGINLLVDRSLFSNVIKHNYNAVGDYEVTLSCKNLISTVEASYLMSVEIPIAGFSLSCPPEYVVVGGVQGITIERGDGSRLTFNVEFGDGQNKFFGENETSQSSSIQVRHTYSSSGKFIIKVFAQNQLGSNTKYCPYQINVQYPVYNMTITTEPSIPLDPGRAVFKFKLDEGAMFPTNGKMDWSFGDGSNQFDLPLRQQGNDQTLVDHLYTGEGFYKISLRLYNNVSEKYYKFNITVQKLIPLQVSVQQRFPQSETTHPGFGTNKTYFVLEGIVVVNIKKQRLDKEYRIDFRDGSEELSSTKNIIEHQYQQPGTYELLVTSLNELETLKTTFTMNVQRSINRFSMEIAPIVKLGEPVEIVLKALEFGTDTCIVVIFGDGNVFLWNEMFCNLQRNQTLNYTSFSEILASPIRFNYTYSKADVFNITVFVYNQVSSFSEQFRVTVQLIPCPKQPEVAVSGGGKKSFPIEHQRSNRIVLQSNVTLICPNAKTVIFLWKLYSVDTNTEIMLKNNHGFRRADMPFQRKPGAMDPTVFELDRNILPYGLVRIDLNVTYESENIDLKDFTAEDSVWFQIMPSRLEARIKGGVRRAVGFEMNVIFDASDSHDPDTVNIIDDIMTYQWFCKRYDEEFPLSFELMNSTNKNAGCFENGKYFLTADTTGFKTLSDDGSIISVKTNLVQGKRYVMRVYVQKGQRRGIYEQEFIILSGAPPSLEIYCTFNCYKTLNPREPLKIQSVCKNCNSTMKINYEWRLFKIHDGLKNNEYIEEEITDLESKTTTSLINANIALKENVLDEGEKYKLKVIAWRTGGAEGFSDFVFTVNRPPNGGFCDVTPKEGETLKTVFLIRCGNWVDENIPLLYTIDIVDGDGGSQNIYSGFEREISTVLPMGQQENDHKYDLIVGVYDSLQFGVTEKYTIRVIEPLHVDFDAVANHIDSMAKTKDLQLFAQTAYAAGLLMNKKSKGEMDNTREKMLKSLNKLQPCKLTEIKQLGGVQSIMTKTTEQLSDKAQEESGAALDAMSECMMSADGADRNMKDAANTLFSATTNILTAGSEKVMNFSNATGKSAADKSLDTINKVGGALMRQMVAGDKPTIMKAGNLTIEMAQVPDNADEEETGFKIPEIKYILGNQSSIEVTGRKASVGAMLTSSPENPYNESKGSSDLKSDVMGLALTDPDGRPMNLIGQELTMYVKRQLSNDRPPILYEYDVTEGIMKVHRFNFTNNNTYMAIEIRPIDEHTNLLVYISYEKRPTVSNTVMNYTQISLNRTFNIKKFPDPYTKIFTASDLNGTGEYYIGVKVEPGRDKLLTIYGVNPTMQYTLRTWETLCKIWDDEEKIFTTSGCWVGPNTTYNKTHCICKVGGESSEPPMSNNQSTENFTTTTTTKSPSVLRQRKVTRASFAGGFFVMPNPIDFSKAFAGFANLADNPVAFATVLAIFGIYLLLLFWARREDRKDIQRAGVTPLAENYSSDCQFYEITVYTGFSLSAATTSNVFFQLFGDEGQTEARQLTDPNRKVFQRRGQDIFLASFPDYIGDLSHLKIWHDNTGKNPAWYLSRVMIHDLNEDRKYLFINGNMIAVEVRDGSLERLLPVAGPEETKSFNHLFFSTTQKNITDNHIWFSVFIRPPKSRFTRVQRLSCCLTLLYCTMVTNAMFYEVVGQVDPSTTLRIGPFAFSPAQIGIGVMTSLIIFPVNILIVGVFRSVGPKPSPEDMKKKKSKKNWWFYELLFCFYKKPANDFLDVLSSSNTNDDMVYKLQKDDLNDMHELDGSTIGLKLDTPAQEQQREEKLKKQTKRKEKLPFWMKYFAWTLLVLTSFTSAFFVVLYGFQFGKEKSAQWMSALFVSFIQDVCVSQPTKIFGLALFVALVVKKTDDDEEEGDSNKKQADEEFLNKNIKEKDHRPKPDKSNIIRFQPPSKDKIAVLRSYRLKELKMYNLLRDIFIYLMFVIALCQVSYSHLDPRSYNMRRSMENIFIEGAYSDKGFPFTKINNVNDIWIWLETTVIDGLYGNTWYNQRPNKPGFVGDLYSNLFGGSRLRQLRVKQDSCKIHKDFDTIIKNCHDWYSWGKEEMEQFDPRWLPKTNESLVNPSKYHKSWEYQTSKELNTYPFVGGLGTYAGGGYVGDMGNNVEISKELVSYLKSTRWLDAQTRAVFFEVTVYNAQINLFAIMNFVIEIGPTNGIELFESIKIARLYTFGGSTASFTIACQFFVLIFFLISIYREVKKIYREKKAYFKGFWNIVECLLIILVFSTIGVFGTRMMLVDAAVKKITENPGVFVSFNKVTQWDVMFSALSSILVLISCIKSIRLLQYNQTISILACTLKGCAKPLAAFSIVFVIFFMAFTIFAYMMFVSSLPAYKNFITASESVMSLLLGAFQFGALREANSILGPIWFVLIMLFGVMYIMNVFLSIIMETYAAVKEDLSMQSQEYELVDFMVKKFMKLIGRGDHMNQTFENLNEKENIDSKKKMTRFPKTTSISNRESFLTLLDEQIEEKFSQLDQSLNACLVDDCSGRSMDKIKKTTGSYITHGYDFRDAHEDLLMEQDLRKELAKWS